MKKFDINAFLDSFNVGIRALRESERVTKDTLRILSRSLLEQLHIVENNPKCGDVGFINDVLGCLTPMNKETMTMYMAEFSGFFIEEGKLVRKNKGEYNDRCAKAMEALEDPHFNVWTWAARELAPMKKKAFDIGTLSKDVKKALNAKNDDGLPLYNKADVIREVLKGGISIEELMEAIN